MRKFVQYLYKAYVASCAGKSVDISTHVNHTRSMTEGYGAKDEFVVQALCAANKLNVGVYIGQDDELGMSTVVFTTVIGQVSFHSFASIEWWDNYVNAINRSMGKPWNGVRGSAYIIRRLCRMYKVQM